MEKYKNYSFLSLKALELKAAYKYLGLYKLVYQVEGAKWKEAGKVFPPPITEKDREEAKIFGPHFKE